MQIMIYSVNSNKITKYTCSAPPPTANSGVINNSFPIGYTECMQPLADRLILLIADSYET